MDIDIPSSGGGAGWGLAGTVGALGAYHANFADIIVQVLLDWYPVIATLATKLAPEFSWLPENYLYDAMVLLAIVVVVTRGATAARNTAGRIGRFLK